MKKRKNPARAFGNPCGKVELEENKRASGLFYPAVRSGIPSLEPGLTGSTSIIYPIKRPCEQSFSQEAVPARNIPTWNKLHQVFCLACFHSCCRPSRPNSGRAFPCSRARRSTSRKRFSNFAFARRSATSALNPLWRATFTRQNMISPLK